VNTVEKSTVKVAYIIYPLVTCHEVLKYLTYFCVFTELKSRCECRACAEIYMLAITDGADDVTVMPLPATVCVCVCVCACVCVCVSVFVCVFLCVCVGV